MTMLKSMVRRIAAEKAIMIESYMEQKHKAHCRQYGIYG